MAATLDARAIMMRILRARAHEMGDQQCRCSVRGGTAVNVLGTHSPTPSHVTTAVHPPQASWLHSVVAAMVERNMMPAVFANSPHTRLPGIDYQTMCPPPEAGGFGPLLVLEAVRARSRTPLCVLTAQRPPVKVIQD